MSKTYSWPNFRWWQFIQKRRWRKAMSHFTAGERIKVDNKVFTDDYTIEGWKQL